MLRSVFAKRTGTIQSDTTIAGAAASLGYDPQAGRAKVAGGLNGSSSPAQVISWRELGYRRLDDTVRRICTVAGWTHASPGAGRVIALSSAVEREGKSTLARAVTISLAQDHEATVLLVECDPLRPSLAHDYDLSGPDGLLDTLAGTCKLENAIASTSIPNLYLLPVGTSSGNPSRLLRSPQMTQLLQKVREEFSFIVLDLPAVLRSSDAAVLGRQADGVVMVVRAGTTDQRLVDEALALLRDTPLQGVVLNRFRTAVPDLVRRLAQY